MKIKLNNNRTAVVRCYIDNEIPKNFYSEIPKGKVFRTYHMNLQLLNDENTCVGQLEGTSYCSPNDQFVKKNGRKLAMKRMLDSNGYYHNGIRHYVHLTKEECGIVAKEILK